MTEQTRLNSIQVQLQKSDFKLDAIFELPDQGLSAIYGPSGCGKTTLLRIIAGLEPNATGQIIFRKKSWLGQLQQTPTHLRDLALIFQTPYLFDHLSISENIRFGNSGLSDNDFDFIIQGLGIESALHKVPDVLSGGEKQRVSIARALWQCPSLLLLDEPVSALDSKAKTKVLQFIGSFCRLRNISLLMVSHNLFEIAQLADQLIQMEAGRVVQQGCVNDALTRLDSTFSHNIDAFSFLDTRVQDYDNKHQLTSLDCHGQTLFAVLPDIQNAHTVRLKIQARDVSLCLHKPKNTSILNILQVTVDAIDGDIVRGQQLVRLSINDQLILARLSSKSVDVLKLEVGLTLFAQIKAVALAE